MASAASGLVFRTRDILVRQRTQIANAVRGHLAEYGFVVPRGAGHFKKLVAHLEDPTSLPEEVRSTLSLLTQTAMGLEEKICLLDKEIARRAREDEVARRLMTIPGVGPITATAIAALAPPTTSFKKGRDFAAWVGLTTLQKSSGGKQKLGATSKMGERTIRRLLIIGAAAVVRNAVLRGGSPTSWLGRMLARKPRMLVIVALANKLARIVWALLIKGEVYQAPVVAVA